MPEKHRVKRKGRTHSAPRPSFTATGAVFAVLCVVLLCWMAVAVHPASRSSADRSDGRAHTNLVSGLDVFSANSRENAFLPIGSDQIEHHFIPEGASAAPVPDVLSYGESYRPRDVVEVIEDARDAGLLGESEQTVFSLSSAFPQDSPILYYLDDSLLAVSWQESIDGHMCTFCEIRIADASQLRRKLSGDVFAAPVKSAASDLAVRANAVAAFPADDYTAHELGIAVYQREVCRMNRWPFSFTSRCFNAIDTLFVDASGNFHFSLAGTQWRKEDLAGFMSEENILFSIVNGPALVIGGSAQTLGACPLGSLKTRCVRSAFAQCGPLHYLYCAAGVGEGDSGCTAQELAELLVGKKVEHAYALVSGRTAELVFDDQVYSPGKRKVERPVGGILYFATALPDRRVTP